MKSGLIGRAIGPVLLGLSACGYPLTQAAIRHWGIRGAALVETVCTGLVLRDTALIASGVPGRLRRAPGALLWLELVAGSAATAAGLRLLFRNSTESWLRRPGPAERVRRATVAALFGLHTIRFWIYLRPDRGRRQTNP